MKDAKSPTFCILPWVHLHAWPDGGIFPCCAWDTASPIATYDGTASLESHWNSEKMRRLRLDLLDGKKPAGCSRCFSLESKGVKSYREDSNEKFAHLEHRAEDTRPDGSLADFRIAYLDLRLSNVCNYRCRSCGPNLSSTWYEDAKALMGVEKEKVLRLFKNGELLAQLEKVLPHLEKIYFAGGEPLVSDEHYEILRFLREHGKTDIELIYNTNFSVLSYRGHDVLELWKDFRSVQVGASLDGRNALGEYVRKGLDWKRIEANRERMLAVCPEVGFYVNFTLSVFNFLEMPRFHRDWVERGLIKVSSWNVNPLTDPECYHVRVAPENLRARAIAEYESHIVDFLGKFSQAGPDSQVVRGWREAQRFLEGEQLGAKAQAEFRKWTRDLDGRRGESFRQVAPELATSLGY